MHNDTHLGPSVFLFEKGAPDPQEGRGTALKHLLKHSFRTLPPQSAQSLRQLQANVVGVASCFPNGSVYTVAQPKEEERGKEDNIWRTEFQLLPEHPTPHDLERLDRKFHSPWYVLFGWPLETAGLPMRRTIRLVPRLLSLKEGESWEITTEVGTEWKRFTVSECVAGVSVEFVGDHRTLKSGVIFGEYPTSFSPGIDEAGRNRILHGLMREILPGVVNDVIHGKKHHAIYFNDDGRVIAEPWYQNLPQHWRERLLTRGATCSLAA